MPALTKQTIFNLLGSDAKPFALMLYRVFHMPENSTDDDEKAIAMLFKHIDVVDLGNSIVQGYVMPVLLSKNIISQATVDRINSYIV